MALTPRTKYRILEIIPGLMIWVTFFLAIFFSFMKPIWVVYFIIVFDVYWMTKIIYLNTYLILSYRKYKKIISVAWGKKVEKMKGAEDIYHAIIFPTVGDPVDVVRKSLAAVDKCSFPSDRIILALAFEERDQESIEKIRPVMEKEFGDKFYGYLVTEHPAHIPGEVIGKGSNETWAGRQMKAFIDKKGIPYENVIISSLDIDTIVHPEYLSYVAYKYLTHPNPTRSSYQPIPLFSNNIWDTHSAARVASFSTSFWMMTEQMRPERLFTFSSHSMPFKALVDVDFWQTDIISEDSRIFLQCFLKYKGKYEVTPLYLPIHLDAVQGKTTWETWKNLYKQQRRWAWGSENIPFMAWHFIKAKEIPFKKRFVHLFNQIEGMWSWATAPILIFVLGYLPLWVIGDDVSGTTLIQKAPYIMENIMRIASIGIVLSMIVATLLMPRKPHRLPFWKYPVILIQWILLPVTMVLFGSVPSAEAQTRLMIGKYLTFNPTPKVRKS